MHSRHFFYEVLKNNMTNMRRQFLTNKIPKGIHFREDVKCNLLLTYVNVEIMKLTIFIGRG